MNVNALVFFLACASALLLVPRRWASVPLLVGCCYMTMGQGIELGAFSLPIYRMLLLVGLFRLFIKGEKITDLGNGADRLMFFLIAWLFMASFFHDGSKGLGTVYISGVIFNLAAVYFLIRAWCRDLSEISDVIAVIAVLLAPIALTMILEKIARINLFSAFGGVPPDVILRDGEYRAQGPFRHPILAGTVGATCIPLFIGILGKHQRVALVGVLSGFCMVVASASSGPLLSMLAGIAAVAMWRFRHLTHYARIAAIVVYFAAQLKMGKPGYWIMARISIGSSTGSHRALLIDSAFRHLNEWWLMGTDVTRHWMPTGVSFSPYHTDITNYYLAFGVMGGLTALLTVVWILYKCFQWVGSVYRSHLESDANDAFLVWCLGAGLFAHALTSVSVSYFDQSLVFFWMNIAMISSAYSSAETKRDPASSNEPFISDFHTPSRPCPTRRCHLKNPENRHALTTKSLINEGRVSCLGQDSGFPVGPYPKHKCEL